MTNTPKSTPERLILCVDDERVGLEIRKIVLESKGYRVLTALDGPTGLQLFASNPVDAVVLDYSMPGMDGGEVAASMRQTKPKVPILMLSAYVSLPDEVMRRVDMYVTKGDGAPVLLAKIEDLLAAVSDSHGIKGLTPERWNGDRPA